MSQDFSKLSYKELQAMAAKHRIPGNIKKNLLVDFLRALKCGDKVQVTRMLSELKENRKRKVRKRKLEKMTAVTSTPLHSPNYSSIDDRFYSPQHLSPFRWVPPEEETLRREDPNYEIFRQYLIQRIQKGYKNFDTNNNDLGIDAAALNLKAGTLESSSRSNLFANPITSNTFMSSPVPDAQIPGIQLEPQTSNDANENFKPMILQRMLQAPLGTNLGAMARLEANRIWPTDNLHSLRELGDNNSDTITADSESVDYEWNERGDYQGFDNRRAQSIFTEQNQIPQLTLEQMINYLQSNNQNGYQQNNQFNFVLPNVQENCQTWIENNPLECRGLMDYVDTNDSSKMYALNSVEEQTNYQYQTDGTLSILEQNNQQSLSNGLQVQNINSYFHHQLPAQQGSSDRQEYYDPTNSSNVCSNNVPFSTNVTPQLSGLQTQDSSQYEIYPQECATSMPYLGDEYFQYSMYQNQHNQPPAYSVASSSAQTNYCSQNGEQTATSRQTLGNAAQKEGNNFLTPYWPKWLSNNSEGYYLENILNMNVGGTTDYSKFNQTSTVYCFAPPLSSPMSGSSSSQYVEQAELVTADRIQAFIPNSLVYSDSTTGMRMAKLPGNVSEETGSDESSLTIGYRSDESCHREPIQEIWIPDFSNREGNDSNDLSSSCETIPD